MEKLKNKDLERISIEEFKKSRKTPITIVLDNVRSSLNVGSVFRTSDAFLIEKIYLCGICATPPNKDIHKTALGATESVAWEYVADTLTLVEKLKNENIKVLAIEQVENSTKLNTFFPEKNQKYAIVMGNEVKGVQEAVVNAADLCIEIPQLGTKHSLNISVTTGIVLWDLFQKLNS